MKKTFLGILAFLSCILTTLSSFSQDYSQRAKTFFSSYLDSKTFAGLIVKSLPNLEDCKLVFKGTDAYTYFGYIEDMKSRIKTTDNKGVAEKFIDVKIEPLTTNDIKQNSGNTTGGMRDIANRLQPNVTFYEVSLLREKNAEYGLSYKYWVKIENRWVYFPRPFLPFINSN